MIYLAGLSVLSLIGSTAALFVALEVRAANEAFRRELAKTQGYVGVLASQLEILETEVDDHINSHFATILAAERRAIRVSRN